MDKSEIEKYGDFRKAIAKELKRQLGAATKTGVDEIVKRILLADVGVLGVFGTYRIPGAKRLWRIRESI